MDHFCIILHPFSNFPELFVSNQAMGAPASFSTIVAAADCAVYRNMGDQQPQIQKDIQNANIRNLRFCRTAVHPQVIC